MGFCWCDLLCFSAKSGAVLMYCTETCPSVVMCAKTRVNVRAPVQSIRLHSHEVRQGTIPCMNPPLRLSLQHSRHRTPHPRFTHPSAVYCECSGSMPGRDFSASNPASWQHHTQNESTAHLPCTPTPGPHRCQLQHLHGGTHEGQETAGCCSGMPQSCPSWGFDAMRTNADREAIGAKTSANAESEYQAHSCGGA